MIRLPRSVVRAVMPAVRMVTLDPATPVAVRRVGTDLIVGSLPGARGVRGRRGTLGGVPTRRFDPPGVTPSPADGVILYFHGGGWVVGSPRSHRPFCERLCAGTGLAVLAADYRLAPEHPFPAAFEDCLAVYRAVRAAGTPAERIVLAGDSAGGALALAVAMAARDLGEQVRVVALLCPVADLGPDALWRSAISATCPLLNNPPLIAAFTRHYVGEDSVDWRASPIYGDFAGLPPLIVHTCGDDPLRPDTLRLIDAAQAAGTKVEHTDYPGLWHVIHLLASLSADGDRAVADFVAAINRT
ncbi:MAG: alpha/beta hydrolase [Sporichthyaceae bacterium]